MASVISDCRPTVLVIEDDKGVARMLRFCLREAGFDATEVSTGSAALCILQQEPPDAAVLDLQLPNGQGGAVLDWLRHSCERTTKSPVWVVISALDPVEAAKRYGPLGSHFLAKPFDPWELVVMLKNRLLAKDEPEQPSLSQGNPITHGRERPAGG
jgi:DNA-binding response OmpR family regulator